MWWVVAFQLLGLIISMANMASPRVHHGSLALLAVLTMTTFSLTNDVGNIMWGITHGPTGNYESIVGGHATNLSNAVTVLFAGLIVCDVANGALLLSLGTERLPLNSAVVTSVSKPDVVYMEQRPLQPVVLNEV